MDNIPEWSDFKIAVLKDTALIDSAGKVMDVSQAFLLAVDGRTDELVQFIVKHTKS
jgi:hypothetical protein